MPNDMREEALAQQLNEWYIESIKQLGPFYFNPSVHKDYGDLTKEQRATNLYLARKVIDFATKHINRKLEEGKKAAKREKGCTDCITAFNIEEALERLKVKDE